MATSSFPPHCLPVQASMIAMMALSCLSLLMLMLPQGKSQLYLLNRPVPSTVPGPVQGNEYTKAQKSLVNFGKTQAGLSGSKVHVLPTMTCTLLGSPECAGGLDG